MKKYILVGRPNVGKSTVFNALTSGRSRVSNYMGATVEISFKKLSEGEMLYDLPGLYSLGAFTFEEKVSAKVIKGLDYEAIIFLIKADEIRQSYNLLNELKRLQKPILVVVTYGEEIRKRGGTIDLKELEKALELPIVPFRRDRSFHQEVSKKLLTLGTPSSSHMVGTHEEIFACGRSIDEKVYHNPSKGSTRSSLILDRIFLHPIGGYFCFFIIMLSVLFISFGAVANLGEFLTSALEELIIQSGNSLAQRLNISPFITRLFVHGIVPSFTLVIGMFPSLLSMYFLMALLEDSGYLSRISLLFEPLLGRLGLGGRSAIAYLLGLGCLVSGMTSTRTIKDEKIKRRTLTTLTYIPCGAKLPVLVFLSRLFFPNSYFLVILICYGLAFFTAMAVAKASQLLSKGKGTAWHFEIAVLPQYHRPSLRVALDASLDDLANFFLKIFTLVFLTNLILYFLSFYNFSLEACDPSQSMLKEIAEIFSYLFSPLGLGDYRLVAGLLSGLIAKEQTLSTLLIISGGVIHLEASTIWSFLIFFTLYTPCVTAIRSLCIETRQGRKVIPILALQLAVSYLVAFLIHAIAIICQ